MNVLMFSDMEGVSGVAVSEQVMAGEVLYQEGRQLYTEDVNAAVRGARAAGAEKILIREFHGGAEPFGVNHLVPEMVHPDCEWIAHHYGRSNELMEEQFDACVLVGFHARAGVQDGILSHTITGGWRRVWLNGSEVGETAIVAALCGRFDIPVVAVTGDAAVCREARELLGDGLTTIAVKQGLSRNSARLIPPQRARPMIEAGVKAALEKRGKVTPYPPPQPTKFRIEVTQDEMTAAFAGRPGVTIEDPFHVLIEAADYVEALYQMFGF
jgi:D-amino peptidase